MEVKDLVKGQIYALKCPVNNYHLKPFIFDKIEHSWFNGLEIVTCFFIGIESSHLIVPTTSLYDMDRNLVAYGSIDASPLTPLEVELL